MKHDPMRTANATAIVGSGLYIICWWLVGGAPGFYRGMMGSWFHGFNLAAMPMRQISVESGLFGLLTFVVVAWIVGYAWAAVYNALGKK